MKFYLNDIALSYSCGEETINCIKELKEVNEVLSDENCVLYIKESVFSNKCIMDMYKEPQKYYPVFSLLGHMKIIRVDDKINNMNIVIDPFVQDKRSKEIFRLCIRDNQNKIVSFSKENIINKARYDVGCGSCSIIIENIIGKKSLKKYLTYNPTCKSIEDVFRKIEKECKHIKFTEKSYKTAVCRDISYKEYGYEKLINMFLSVEKILYPYFKGETDMCEKQIQQIFKEKCGVEFSQEKKSTMLMFGEEREVLIDNLPYQFTYHLKPGDNRIYFKYFHDRNYIYFGYAGAHLDTVGRRTN